MSLNSAQILFSTGSSEPLSATGVEIITDGKKWELKGIKKEIIVSCGDKYYISEIFPYLFWYTLI